MSEMPTCPGCHFGCKLDAAQCARGLKFFDKWQAGEEIPERRVPWGKDGKRKREGEGQPSKGRKMPPHLAAMPTSARLMMLLNITGAILRDRDDAERDRRIAECIVRQDGAAANRIIAERTRLDDAAINEQVTSLKERGLVESRTLDDGRVFHEITEAGRAQVETWMEERKADDEAFFEALSDDEAAQLEDLLARALDPHMRRGPRK